MMKKKMVRDIDKIIVHCSATKPSSDIDVETVRRWHVEGNGWQDVGYHFFVKLDGTIEPGRPVEIAGAHAKYHNANSIGVCYAGGVDEDMKPSDTRTEAQKNSLEMLISILLIVYGNHIEVIGHRDLPGVAKACPSFDVKSWWKEVNGDC